MFFNIKSRSDFFKNVSILAAGALISQLIAVLISPILTRLYSPSDFGNFAFYTSIISICTVLANGRYELTIMLPKKDNYAKYLMIVSLLISFLVFFILFFFISIFNIYIYENEKWLYFIPFNILLIGLCQIFNYALNRKRQFLLLSKSKVLQSFFTSISSVIAGYFMFGNYGLIISLILGYFFTLLYFFKKTNLDCSFTKINFRKIIFFAKKYADYPKKSLVGALFNSISYQIEILLLATFYSNYYLGLYYFITKFTNILPKFLSGAIWQVFLVNTKQTKEIIFNDLHIKQKKIIHYTTFPIIVGLFVYSDFFIFIFGHQWKEATIFLYPLIFAMHSNFVVASFSLFLIINKPEAEMTFNILLSLLKLFSVVIAHTIWSNILITVMSFSLVQFFLFLFLGSWNYKQLGKNYMFMFKMYLPTMVLSLLSLLILNYLFADYNLLYKTIIYIISLCIYFGIIKYAKL